MLTDAKEDYTRGHVPFLGATIYLDSKPLIPRTETEYWVEKAITEIPEDTEVRVLDLFAGSGAIGVAVMHHRPLARVTFGEYEEQHLPTIRKTIRENGLDMERASVVQTNVWSGIAGPFEFILANPPYISKERQTVARETEAYEPEEALFADDDGFFYIKKIISKLPQFSLAHTTCYIEHEPFHTEKIHDTVAEFGLIATTHKDQYGVERYSRLSVA